MSTPDWKNVAKERLQEIRRLKRERADFAERAGEIARRQTLIALKSMELPLDDPRVKARVDAICEAVQDAARRAFDN